MGGKTLYFLFTDTGTWLSKLINFYTKQKLNHVSIGFDPDLEDVYSFGRKYSGNPFAGGFVKEDIGGEVFKDASCAIYTCCFSEIEWASILRNVQEIEACRAQYKFNFLGLIGVLFHIKIERKQALFCSQFVAAVLRDVATISLNKPACFTTPADIRKQPQLQMVYWGRLGSYRQSPDNLEPVQVQARETVKRPLLGALTQSVKRFILK